MEFKKIEDFAGYILKRLKDTYGAQRSIELKTVQKNNGVSLLALAMENDESGFGPAIYVNPYHTQYLLGNMNLDEIVEDIMMLEKTTRLSGTTGMNKIGDYESVRHKIVFRLINAGWNKELLEDVPHIPYLDLAIIFCLSLGETEYGTLTAVIHNKHMEYWNCSVKDLWRNAADNTPREYPLEVRNMDDIICDMVKAKLGDEFETSLLSTLLCDADVCRSMYVISNSSGIYGAGCILYKDALKNMAEKLGSDLIVIPSSVHEMLVTRYMPESNVEELSDMVKKINQTDVAEEDRLSDEVYLYCRDAEQIKRMK